VTPSKPDVFVNVHNGIRSALFATCLAFGRAGDDPKQSNHARKLLAEALHFVVHHGENEDLILLPMLAGRDDTCFNRLQAEHARLQESVTWLLESLQTAPMAALRPAVERFIADYLLHMVEEEQELEPKIRAAVPPEELSALAQRSVARTPPDDQRMMLGWMLPAMPRDEAMAFLSRLPAALAEELRLKLDTGEQPDLSR
jgi:hypothetical protein